MITAIMIITSMYIHGDMRTHMPSMKECLDARVSIIEQYKDAKTLCVPAITETDKMERFFSIFMGIVTQMKELENDSRGIGSFDTECTDCEG